LTTGTILSVQALSIQFDNRSVIHNLSFAVDAGDNVAIIGPNGAGKTVLLKALLGLLPFRGEIHWSPGVRLGYVPQKVAADRQMPIRVHDLLAAKAHVLKLPPRSIDAVATLARLNTGGFRREHRDYFRRAVSEGSHRICITRGAQCAAFRRTYCQSR
jgi:zinc transport system ATP-binding protein